MPAQSPQRPRHGLPAKWRRRGLMLLAGLFLFATVCLLYSRSVRTPFIFDDGPTIEKNKSIRQLWPPFGDDQQPGPLNPPGQIPTTARQLVNLSFAVNYYFGGLDPFGYHAFNILLHAVSTLLLALIVYRTLRLEYFAGRFDRAAGWLAVASALLWALHPLNTETVSYVTQRTEGLMGVCYLAAIYASQRYWAATRTLARASWVGVAVLACLTGSLSKEMIASVPATVLLYEWTFISGSIKKIFRNSWPLYVAIVLALSPLAITDLRGLRTPLAGFDQGISPVVWWMTQAKVLLMYLQLTFWPWPLAIHYETAYIETFAEAWPFVVPVVAAGVAILWLLWRRRPAGYVGAWVLIVLSPTIVIPLAYEVAVERRMYVPLAAIAPFIVVGGYALISARSRRLPAAGTAWQRRRRR